MTKSPINWLRPISWCARIDAPKLSSSCSLKWVERWPIRPKGDIGLFPNTGNRILRPNNQEKRAVRIVQRPPSEANIARTVCDLNSSVTTKPCPLGEMPQPGYKRAVIWYLDIPIPFCGIGSIVYKLTDWYNLSEHQQSLDNTKFDVTYAWKT